uniref:Type I polyketide synthase n=1 Tax=Gambierdiscus polynesiensis TaxID=439318 RepID=A0A1S6K831_9DINO|nr:type I polyketide synthase [Gambierdiscus polynesiensis]
MLGPHAQGARCTAACSAALLGQPREGAAMSSDIPGGFPPGALVAINGVTGKVASIEGTSSSELIDVNGEKAQLIEWNAESGEWLAVTFQGCVFRVAKHCCFLLTPEELEGCDLTAGPSSVSEELVHQMSDLLVEKGFATMNVLLSSQQRTEVFSVVKGLEEDDLFTRLPAQFEAGYLGKSGKGKVALLESLKDETPLGLLASALPAQDQSYTLFSQLLQPHVLEHFGFNIYSRTNLLLRLSFSSTADEAKYVPPAAQSKEADAFLAMMSRKRLCLLHFLGPAAGELRLIPRAAECAEVTLSAEPNTLVIFITDQYDYSYAAQGESLTLQTFFLSEPLQFEFQGTGGSDVEVLGKEPAIPGAPPPAGEHVIVAGMASRDPCCADMHEKLWSAVRHAGCDGFLEIPVTRFDVGTYIDYSDQQRAVSQGKSYCRHQGHVEGIDIFDAGFFNVPEQEAFGMDPEQRVLMETGWLSMAHAGYDKKKLHKDSAHLGVFVGISGSDWRDCCQVPSANGVPETFIANRFSYAINLKGPSFIMNTACSASLVATHSAKIHLLQPTDPLDGCICAGISLNLSPGTWAGNCAGNMLSFGGRSFTFNGSADGYGRGEGSAAMVIWKGEYSPNNDPPTYALLAGSHTNSDGRSASLTAPNGPAQQRLLRAVLTETQLQAVEIDVYEAHGTGTSLGDPIEVGAVRKVMNKREHPCMISCSKTNLGHLEGGAGMSAFCKCIMAVMHSECAPNQHLREQNPHLDIEGWPANLLMEAQPMKADPSYVGVSGFGYGGTNSHALAYGKNMVTSRGTNQKYMMNAVYKKIKAASVPEVWMDGDNYEEWATSGVPHLLAAPGKTYHIELLAEGKAVWREAALPEISDTVSSFQILGSFSNWDRLPLEPSRDVEGLYTYEVTLGSKGRESFQISVDNDPELVLYPETPSCTRKATPVLGPSQAPSQEYAWVMKGDSGARYRVEVFKSGPATSVTWLRVIDQVEAVQDLVQE